MLRAKLGLSSIVLWGLSFALAVAADNAPSTPPEDFARLVRERRELTNQVTERRNAGDADGEWNAAPELHQVETNLLRMSESIPQVDPQELAQLRDQHVGLLHWLAQRYEEQTEYATCESLWSDAMTQCAKLHGERPWASVILSMPMRCLNWQPCTVC